VDDQKRPPSRLATATDLIAKAVPISAAMLPVAGAAYRVVSFSVSSTPVPTVIAATLPIADLAAIGAVEVLAPGAVMVAYQVAVVLVVRKLYVVSGTRRSDFLPHSRWGRRLFVLFWGAPLAFFPIMAVLVGPLAEFVFLTMLTTVTPALLAFLVISQRPVPLWRIVVAVAVTALTFGGLSGLRANSAGTLTVDVVVAPDSGIVAGRYVQLGSDDRGVWLLSCSTQRVILAAETSILSRTIVPDAALASRGTPREYGIRAWLAGDPGPSGFKADCP
jgi:hypothetical protein